MRLAGRSRRVLLCVLAMVPLVAVAEMLAGALFGALLGTLLFPILGTILGLVLGGAAGCLAGLPVGLACAVALAPYLAVGSGKVRDGMARRGRFVLGAAALCAAAAPFLLAADWAAQPYSPRLEGLLPFRFVFAWLDSGDTPADGPPAADDPVGAALIETFLFLFVSCGAALGGAIAAGAATVPRRLTAGGQASPEGSADA